ncbi:MAG: hypothetical protein A2Y41_06525 [Spirochaetes bacterium GWB1_36_13]|nr:MAG: hypothetical protein A2Y41_06525 [Spirochaetes bacterium GWB1_36_13]
MLTKVLVHKDFYEIMIPIDEANEIEIIRNFIDYLRVKKTASQSVATDEDIEILSKEINQSYWQENKTKFLK